MAPWHGVLGLTVVASCSHSVCVQEGEREPCRQMLTSERAPFWLVRYSAAAGVMLDMHPVSRLNKIK